MNDFVDLTMMPPEIDLGMMDESPQTKGEMSEDELKAYIVQEETTALGYFSGTIANERAKALEYYYGEPFGNEVEGRSQVISTDVSDAIEGLLPGLLEPFISSDEIVKFSPVGPGDEDSAEQETEYVNHVVTQKNKGPLIFYTWFKDALMQKVGIVKYYWERKQISEIENYKGLTEEEMNYIFADMQNGAIELLEMEQYDNPAAAQQKSMALLYSFDPAQVESIQQMPVPQLFNVKVRKIQSKGLARIVNVPPEELLVSAESNSIDIKESRFVEHRKRMTISEIRNMGFNIPDDIEADEGDLLVSPEYQARRDDEENESINQSNQAPANRVVLFREAYYRIDWDGDGIAELRKICMVGNEILLNEEAEEIQFAVLCPYITPHKFFGQSVADKTMDIQLKKSTIERQWFDNIYTINNNRMAISNRVNLDDILDEGIPGVVRVEADQVGNDIMPLPVVPIGQVIEPMLNRLDNEKMTRVGYTPLQPEMDANAINNTATGVRAVTTSTQSRQKLIARMFAETGVKDLMVSIHGMLRRHATEAETIQLRDKWVTVDPRGWVKRVDMTVSVGLGSGTQEDRIRNSSMILQMQAQANQLVPGRLVQPPNAYHALVELTKAMGIKDYTPYWTDPDTTQPPPPPPNPDMVRAETEAKKAESEAQYKLKTLELEVQKLALQKENLELEAKVASTNLMMENRRLRLQEDSAALNDVMTLKNSKQQQENNDRKMNDNQVENDIKESD